MTMKLRTTLLSAFGQKVIKAAQVLGISDQIEILDTDFQDEDDPLRVENPLGKMPVLTTEEGVYIYDSRVIIEYLNDRFNGNLIPRELDLKAKIKTQEALSDGIIDAGVLIVYERRLREEAFVYEPWLKYQREKIFRGFNKLQELNIDPTEHNVATISIGCLLRWITIRKHIELPDAQASYFADWLERFESSLP
jgi:glutathione S-transferase